MVLANLYDIFVFVKLRGGKQEDNTLRDIKVPSIFYNTL